MRHILAVCLLVLSVAAGAVPAKRIKKNITLADGTQKEVVLVGDENIHYYLDADNIAYTRNENGEFVKNDRRQLEKLWEKRLDDRNRRRLQRAEERGMITNPHPLRTPGARRRAQWGAEQNPISGDKKGLVILVNFADLDLDEAHRQDFYDRFFNEEGFSEADNRGSVHDYFYECSYGQFNLTFDVYGPVTVSKSYTYYGKNDSYGYDLYPGEMVQEACTQISQLDVDFSKYDWDDDGYVDQVLLIYAGYGENADAPTYTIWPHESSLTDEASFGDGNGPITLNGVTIDTYAVSCELDGYVGNTPAGIGVACHEFSHCMCIPDFYNTNRSANFYGMDAWDLMDYGSYAGNNNGNCPTPYTSYERMYCGWLTPRVLDTPCVVKGMNTLYDTPEAYIIYNDANRNEYYMLENRQKQGFGASDPASGLLILHVFFDSHEWIFNSVNASDIQRMTIIPADGIYSRATNYADTWPGSTGKTELTDTSTPASTLYTENAEGAKMMGKPIEDIEDADGKINFIFCGGMTLDTPNALDAAEVNANSFKARWDAVENAANYKVMLTAEDLEPQPYTLSETTLLQEDFGGFCNGKTYDGTTDVSFHLDDYTSVPEWFGSKLYTTPQNEVKIGNARSEGLLSSPWLTTQSGDITFVFTARQYETDSQPLQYLYNDKKNRRVSSQVNLNSEPTRYIVHFPTNETEFCVGLSCEGRCYISDISVYEGIVTEEQLESGIVNLKKTHTQTIETQQNSYVFTNLSNQCKYTYIVCAQNGKALSEWSNDIEVFLPADPDGIGGLAPALSQGGEAIYDLSGRKMVNGKWPDGKLPKGIYIINGKKVIR